MPKVTIITSIYQVEDYIERFIQSLKSQTSKEFIVLFVNDGTPDNSISIIRQLTAEDERFSYAHVDKNGHIFHAQCPQNEHEAANYGVYATRNTGLSLVRTPYFTFIDPDDWIDHHYIEKLLHTAETSGADLTKAELCRVYENGKTVFSPRNPKIQKDIALQRHPAQKCCGSQAITCLFKTCYVQKYQMTYKDRTCGFEYDADDIFLLEYLLHKPTLAFCEDTQYYYFQRSTSAVHTINSKRFISTIECRRIEIQCLNQFLESQDLTPSQYALVAKRIIWELSKHYRIYLKAENFDKEKYLSGCADIVKALQWNPHLPQNAFSFFQALLNNDLSKAHYFMSNPICIALDKLRLLPYGI